MGRKIIGHEGAKAWGELHSKKPVCIPSATVPDEFRVTFADGSTALIYKAVGAGHYQPWTWEVERMRDEDSRRTSGPSSDSDWALRSAWCAVVGPPPAILAGQLPAPHECESMDRGDYTKLMRAVLKARTGITFACKGSTGTAWSWLSVNAPPARCDYSTMGPLDNAILSAVFGEHVHQQGQSIPPTSGYRAWHLYKAAGYDTSEITLREHGWD